MCFSLFFVYLVGIRQFDRLQLLRDVKEVGAHESSVVLYQPEQPLGQEVDTEYDSQSSSSLQRLTLCQSWVCFI